MANRKTPKTRKSNTNTANSVIDGNPMATRVIHRLKRFSIHPVLRSINSVKTNKQMGRFTLKQNKCKF
jgi:hypothetical protein